MVIRSPTFATWNRGCEGIDADWTQILVKLSKVTLISFVFCDYGYFFHSRWDERSIRWRNGKNFRKRAYLQIQNNFIIKACFNVKIYKSINIFLHWKCNILNERLYGHWYKRVLSKLQIKYIKWLHILYSSHIKLYIAITHVYWIYLVDLQKINTFSSPLNMCSCLYLKCKIALIKLTFEK